MSEPKLDQMHQKILDVLIANQENGITMVEIRHALGAEQEHFERRLRELRESYKIVMKRQGKKYLYFYMGVIPESEREDTQVSGKLRAEILEQAKGRCRMCGRTIELHGITLHVDHKIPRSWGGKTERENLWAICSTCNEGKKNYFSTFSEDLMKDVLKEKSVHTRIARLLRMKIGEPVDSDLIQFVANFESYQEDWQKRLRELRYLGLEIEQRSEQKEKRKKSYYCLTKWVDLPANPTQVIRAYERQRAELHKQD